uniref:Uncharacterized protein n=1 Tax=viral metagenome TaxID=1070528 RepID=A0A6M3XHX1_9ZZZZ
MPLLLLIPIVLYMLYLAIAGTVATVAAVEAAPQAAQAVANIVDHAMERHGEGALIVRNCFSQNGVLTTFHNPATGRKADVCEVGDGLYGLRICETNGDEVTCFLKEKLRTLEQVIRYLKNTGYVYP